MIPNKHLLQNYKYVVTISMLKSIAFQPSNSHISTELLMRKVYNMYGIIKSTYKTSDNLLI